MAVNMSQLYLSCLAHASYVVSSDGVAAIVDPRRDVDVYLEEAEKEGLEIAYIIETHLHADFVSGHRELAEKTGATVLLSKRAGATFPHRGVGDGDTVTLGTCRLRFLETPGHTPESICIVVEDLEKAGEPLAVLTGDTLFIGDVGRPDLAKDLTPAELAGMLYDSLHQKLLALPDGVEVYPAHGAGSLCGRNISSDRKSTIGRERAYNHALRPMPKEEFVRMMTTDLPDRPQYFASDAEINRAGAPGLDELPKIAGLSPAEVGRLVGEGVVVVDTRSPEAFAQGHVPGSIHLGLSGQFASWAGTLLGVAARIVLVAEDAKVAGEARTRLSRVGIDGVEGFLEGGVSAWEAAGNRVETLELIDVKELARRLSEDAGLKLLDVRRKPEWSAAHLDRARLLPLSDLRLGGTADLSSLPHDAPLVVHCKSGYRSLIAASLLQRAGISRVANVTGGLDAWQAAGLPSTPAAGG